ASVKRGLLYAAGGPGSEDTGEEVNGPDAANGEVMSAAAPPPDESFSVIYDELRRLAAAQLAGEPTGHTLDATALVHEAYLRLGGAGSFESKSQYVRA